jgi:hypothetical protein
MPYMKNGKRDYKRENELYNSKPEQRANRSERTVARNQANADGRTSKGDGKDLDHRVPLSKGGSSAKSNLRVVSKSQIEALVETKTGV